MRDAVRDNGGAALDDEVARAVGRGRQTWAVIDLDAVAFNVRQFRARLGPGVELICVVKGNGYGCGAPEVARAALEAGATRLAVATVEEAAQLRAAGLVDVPLLIMGAVFGAALEAAVELEAEFTVYDREQALAASQAAARLGARAGVHLKVDTGLGRLGVRTAQDAADLARLVAGQPSLRLAGTCTHMAVAEWPDKSYTRRQFARFEEALAAIVAAGIDPGLRHCANTAVAIDLPEMGLDAARVALGVVGLYPGDPARMRRAVELRPVMTLKSRVAQVKEVPAGTGISYGLTYTAPSPRRLATVTVGYADGYRRAFSNRAAALVRGGRAAVVGTVCMDHIMLDVSETGAAPGDEVVLIGRQGGAEVTFDELAAIAQTNSYEIVTCIGPRVTRVYVKGGRVAGVRVLGANVATVAADGI